MHHDSGDRETSCENVFKSLSIKWCKYPEKNIENPFTDSHSEIERVALRASSLDFLFLLFYGCNRLASAAYFSVKF